MYQPLLPQKISSTEPSHQTVEELADVLENAIKKKKLRNIALTGPFGSGKSSILQTLMEEFQTYHYLPISLATLHPDEDVEQESETSQESETPKERTKRIEELNRKVEYSILQQLIYREKAKVVPNSRFRRIVHLDKWELIKYSWGCIGFILTFLIAFEPQFAKIETLYNFFNLGSWNLVFDIVAVLYMVAALYYLLLYIIKSYCNSKLNKLNLKDGEIQVIENNSIFNKHLDEILYFFQVTDYNVVIIEDLDRFGTPDIFLKLRELNQLINESKIVDRQIVFLYAVKDDVFVDEERTKFFDYITTVIPVINPSNSKVKFKKALAERGCKEEEIPDDDLTEMAFFIQDMRILTNIANEYCQYKQKLCNGDDKKQQLSLTKLLAMIVYKNYHPKDFAQLHRREGKVYLCISSKKEFTAIALETLDEKKKALEKKKQIYYENLHIQENELRMLFMYSLREKINEKMFSIQIDNNYQTLKSIATDSVLFGKLIKLSSIRYQHYYYGSFAENNSSINIKEIDKTIRYSDRIIAIKSTEKSLEQEEKSIEKEVLQINSLTLKQLISKYQIGDQGSYREIELSPIMDVFIRLGYLNEEYYDYISYFYEGMVSLSDRDLLLSIKRQIKQNYDYHINKIENFVKELKYYMFENDAILNNELLDFLARKKNVKEKELFTLIMNRIERDDAPLDFLSQYYIQGKQQEKVFTSYIEWNKVGTWNSINNHSDEIQKDTLREAWLKYCGKKNEEQLSWLNNNYSFLTSRAKSLGIKRCLELVEGCNFIEVNTDNTEILNHVIISSCYSINKYNLCLITNYTNKDEETTSENLNLTRIEATGNNYITQYVEGNISEALPSFSKECNDESAECILFILNSPDITTEQKTAYLDGQTNLLEDYEDINESEMQTLATKLYLIKPTWKNVAFYYKLSNNITNEWIAYIEHFANELSSEHFVERDCEHPIFERLFEAKYISLENYQSLCCSFDSVFENNEEIAQLDKERLLILLQLDKIPFSSENTVIMQETPIYADYLIHYSTDFYNNLNEPYNLNWTTALNVLKSDKFTMDMKRNIINIVDPDVIRNSQPLADMIISIMLCTNIGDMNPTLLNDLIHIAKNIENKVKIVTKILSSSQQTEEEITNLLSLMGEDKYIEIAERIKKPVFDPTPWNISLLTILEKNEFISSLKEEKNGIRVNPRRIKE